MHTGGMLHQIILYLVASMRSGNNGQSGKVRNHWNVGRKMARARLLLSLGFRNEGQDLHRGGSRVPYETLESQEIQVWPFLFTPSRPFPDWSSRWEHFPAATISLRFWGFLSRISHPSPLGDHRSLCAFTRPYPYETTWWAKDSHVQYYLFFL